MIPVVTIRPALGAGTTLAAGQRHGLQVHSFPMSEVCALDWQAPDPAAIDALLIGSANAIRFGGPALQAFLSKPVLAVGAATAAAARTAGFRVDLVGQGGLQGLLGQLPDGGELRLLRVAARDHVPLNLPPQVSVVTRIAYEARDLPMPPALVQLLRQDEGALVLLHAGAIARHFRSQCDALGIDRSAIRIAALGPRIADAAGPGWHSVKCAERPREQALLSLAADMCH